MAVSAVDMALWDLKARLLGLPLADALPRFRDSVPIYGSGGFTSYDADALREQARGWVRAGMRSVKIKVGRDPDADPERIKVVREVIGPNVELMVDANGAYGSVAEALEHAERFRELGVVWLEEPLPNDDLEGLARLRRERPPGSRSPRGEYNWSLFDAERLLSAGAVDVLQSDVTRCGGMTELLRIDGVCRAHGVPFSAPLRAGGLGARLLRDGVHQAPRVLPRPRPGGVPALRGDAGTPTAECSSRMAGAPGLGLELRVRGGALPSRVSMGIATEGGRHQPGDRRPRDQSQDRRVARGPRRAGLGHGQLGPEGVEKVDVKSLERRSAQGAARRGPLRRGKPGDLLARQLQLPPAPARCRDPGDDRRDRRRRSRSAIGMRPRCSPAAAPPASPARRPTRPS